MTFTYLINLDKNIHKEIV